MAEPLSSFTGLSSGMDWRALVDQIIALDRRPADKLQATLDANVRRKEALGQFQTAVQALQDAADKLASGAAFDTFGVTAAGVDAAGRSVLAATAGAGAVAGTYDVQVTALARAQKLTAGVGFAPDTDLAQAGVTPGTLTLARGGATLGTVEVRAGDTLATVRDTVNALNAGTPPSGVVASIVNVSPTEQRLVLTATGAGTGGAFTLSDDGASGLRAALGLDAAAADAARRPLEQAAQDAAFTVDGLPITRSTNSAADVIPGVTLALSALGTSTVTVERQQSAAADAAKAFVDAYNKVQGFVAAQGKGDTAPLRNDSLLRTVRGALSQRAVGAATPTAANGVAADLTSLGALGITVQRDGTLAVAAATFDAASRGRLGDVRALLAERMAAFSAYAGELARPLTGTIDQRESGIDAQSARLGDRIADIDARLEKKRLSLLAQYSKFEGALGRLKSIGDSLGAQLQGLNARDDDD